MFMGTYKSFYSLNWKLRTLRIKRNEAGSYATRTTTFAKVNLTVILTRMNCNHDCNKRLRLFYKLNSDHKNSLISFTLKFASFDDSVLCSGQCYLTPWHDPIKLFQHKINALLFFKHFEWLKKIINQSNCFKILCSVTFTLLNLYWTCALSERALIV